jgi:TPP-dependent pyruvate/acetoin dehydrogenase alpha subunit
VQNTVYKKKEKLIYFERKVANLFNNKKIKSPIHLHTNNEFQLIKIFKKIKKQDWIFCSWRSHYHCLLKGVGEKKLLRSILQGRSISLCFKKEKIFSSAIVGGNIPIAVGVALGLKLKKKKNKVYCFVGDMTSETGIFNECLKFSRSYKLPIHFIIEDNQKSVCTDTKKVWKLKKLTYEKKKNKFITYYKYKLTFPHSGAGVRVQF